MSAIIDYFAVGIDELPRKQQAEPAAVLRVLAKAKRFSIFEATANDVIARTMDRLFERDYVRSLGGSFPWTNVEITDAGLKLMEGSIA